MEFLTGLFAKTRHLFAVLRVGVTAPPQQAQAAFGPIPGTDLLPMRQQIDMQFVEEGRVGRQQGQQRPVRGLLTHTRNGADAGIDAVNMGVYRKHRAREIEQQN